MFLQFFRVYKPHLGGKIKAVQLCAMFSITLLQLFQGRLRDFGMGFVNEKTFSAAAAAVAVAVP